MKLEIKKVGENINVPPTIVDNVRKFTFIMDNGDEFIVTEMDNKLFRLGANGAFNIYPESASSMNVEMRY